MRCFMQHASQCRAAVVCHPLSVCTSGGSSIRSGMNPCVKIGEVGLQNCRVLVPRPAIDTRGRALLQAEEGPLQNLDADVVQERGQLLLPVPGNSAPYAGLRL